MAVLTVQSVTRAGLVPTYAAAAGGGDSFANDGRTVYHVKNAHIAPWTVTVATQMTVDGKAVADDAVVVTNGTDALIGPFPPSIYNDVNGQVQVTYSGVTALTVAAIRLP